MMDDPVMPQAAFFYPGIGVLVVLVAMMGTWYYWLSPLEREMCRKLAASEAHHLWANLRSFGGWVHEKYSAWRAKKPA